MEITLKKRIEKYYESLVKQDENIAEAIANIQLLKIKERKTGIFKNDIEQILPLLKERDLDYIIRILQDMGLIDKSTTHQNSKKMGGGFKPNFYPIIFEEEKWKKYFQIARTKIEKTDRGEGKP